MFLEEKIASKITNNCIGGLKILFLTVSAEICCQMICVRVSSYYFVFIVFLAASRDNHSVKTDSCGIKTSYAIFSNFGLYCNHL